LGCFLKNNALLNKVKDKCANEFSSIIDGDDNLKVEQVTVEEMTIGPNNNVGVCRKEGKNMLNHDLTSFVLPSKFLYIIALTSRQIVSFPTVTCYTFKIPFPLIVPDNHFVWLF
jgi:hypothetical protein